jgi:cytochrome b561
MSHPTGYSKLQIRLHWITVCSWRCNTSCTTASRTPMTLPRDRDLRAVSLPVAGHAAGGLIILGLRSGASDAASGAGRTRTARGRTGDLPHLSHWAHIAFYALLIALPISGVMAWGGQIEAAGDIHEVLRALMIVLILAHIGAVVVHQVVWKTGVMTRMMRPD